jgi:hypothetical protein
MSALGADFPAPIFVRTPISTIRWVLREIDDKEQAAANTQALPTARLTQLLLQIAHGFSGSRKPAPKTKVQEFLPYPEWKPRASEAEGPDQPTRFILTELGRQRRLPGHILTALLTPAERRP